MGPVTYNVGRETHNVGRYLRIVPNNVGPKVRLFRVQAFYIPVRYNYVAKLCAQCETGQPVYGGIIDSIELRRNLDENAVPLSLLDNHPLEYSDFLAERRKLMAAKLKDYYFSL